VRVKDPIAIKCCQATKRLRRRDNCERGATAYSENFTTRWNDCRCRIFAAIVYGALLRIIENIGLRYRIKIKTL